MPTELDLVRTFDRELREQSKLLCRLDQYYEGEQPLKYMAPALEAEIGDRIAQVVINWPRLVTDAYEHLLDVEGFRYPDVDGGDDLLWEWWQENDGDQQSQEAHLEALVNGRSFVLAGAPDDPDDAPVMTVEHPMQVHAHYDAKTRRIKEGCKRWVDDDRVQWATLYLPNSNVYFRQTRKGEWVEDWRSDHDFGTPLLSQLTNQGRMMKRLGVSIFKDIIPLADAANKMATDMMIAGEFHAMPRRWVVGMTEEDFLDEKTGIRKSTWSAVAGRLWASKKSPKDVQYGQFAEAELRNFHETLKLLAQFTVQLALLPNDYLGFQTTNPPSADGVRATEVRKIKRAERISRSFGNGWEAHECNMLRVGGRYDRRAKRIETLWRNPATPTVAQAADAAVKLVQEEIIPPEQAREDLRYSPEQRKRMADWDRERADRNLLGSLSDQLRLDLGDQQPPPAGDAAA